VAYLSAQHDWASLETAIKTFLGVTGTDDDALLEALTTEALKAGDQYMDNPFYQDSDGDWIYPDDVDTTDGTDVAAGVDVMQGVYDYILIRFLDYGKTAPNFPAGTGGEVVSKSIDRVKVTYAQNSRANLGEVDGKQPYRSWDPYKLFGWL
jgi:hypothetical protein